MEVNIIKQDEILAAIGLKREMIWKETETYIFDRSKFINYVSSEYKNSKLKESDEFYRMSEFILLHIDTGLRILFSTSENYVGDKVYYNFIYFFIITRTNKELFYIDVDFDNNLFLTTEGQIPFSEVSMETN